ncbi:MAG: hypothetical protein U9P00_01665 [Pseudomonadota bacterium]|nr:hypothetical protein [Pseudomonadota bacterium]
MTGLQLTIPAQDKHRPGVKIKPREVSEWLDNLPYLDLQRAAQAASQQLRLMNRQTLPPAARLEILGHFLGAYQRLNESLPANPADAHAVQPLLKRLCQDIGFGYKIVAHQLINKRSGFIETRSLPLALLGSIYTLGLQLIYYYAGYQRAPRALWGECLALYSYAWQTGRESYASMLPGSGRIQIEASFHLIALLRLADPYCLPAGMMPVLKKYFEAHGGLVSIETEADCGQVSVPLTAHEHAVEASTDKRMFLNLAALTEQMDKDIKNLQRYGQTQSLGLPPEVPASTLLRTLQQVHDHWRNRRTRAAERQAAHARIELVSGLDTAYCMLNRGRWFNPALFLAPGHEDIIDLGGQPLPDAPSHTTPALFTCTSTNRSSGGLAVSYRGTQAGHPRVGQLVALRRASENGTAGWVIAVVRWRVEAESSSGFDLGLQYLAREPRPVVIRLIDSSGLGGDYQPAVSAIQKRGQQRVHTLITRSEEIQIGDEVTIYEQSGDPHSARCIELLESAPGFERFIYELV